MKNYKIELKWGLLFVAMTLVWMIFEKLFGLYDEHIAWHETISSFIFIPAVTMYVLAFLDKKKNFYQGSMTYGQGFKSGLIISLVVTVISPITQYIATEWIGPEYFPNIINYVVENEIMSETDAESLYNLKSYIFQGLIGAPIMGTITSALVAIFTRSKNTGN